MSEKMHESMSAMMDGEATDFEMRRLLEMADDPAMREKWQRYQIASSAMKRDRAVGMAPMDISAAVSAAIRHEEMSAEVQRRPARAMTGFASAAAIAFAAVIGVKTFQGGGAATDASVAMAPVANPAASATDSHPAYAGSPVAPVALVSSPGANASGLQEVSLNTSGNVGAQRSMDSYFARHAEYARARDVTQAASTGRWQARWLPDGYRLVAVNTSANGRSLDPELASVYSDGSTAFSVFVSNASTDVPASLDLHRGETIACARRIQSGGVAYTATVVGNIPQTSAERIATSVYQASQ